MSSDLPGYPITSSVRRAIGNSPHHPSCAQWRNLSAACSCNAGAPDGGWDPDVMGSTHDSGMAVDLIAYPTSQASDICQRLVPEWMALFLQKNLKYRKVSNDLGPRGVFPDINRKHGIIRDRVWDGSEPVGEPTREVILDQIGHLFLMLHMMDQEEKGV